MLDIVVHLFKTVTAGSGKAETPPGWTPGKWFYLTRRFAPPLSGIGVPEQEMGVTHILKTENQTGDIHRARQAENAAPPVSIVAPPSVRAPTQWVTRACVFRLFCETQVCTIPSDTVRPDSLMKLRVLHPDISGSFGTLLNWSLAHPPTQAKLGRTNYAG